MNLRPAFALALIPAALWSQPAGTTNLHQPFTQSALVDSSGNQYYFGTFGAVTTGAIQSQNGGGNCLFSNGFFGFIAPCTDAYVSKVDSTGHQIFGTYLGGSTNDQTNAVAVDSAGNIYFIGATGGSFPTTSSAAIPTSSTAKTFAAKISSDGARLLYATYLPDTVASVAAIAVDSQGDAYIAGASGSGHAAVLKLNPAGSSVLYNIVLGGSKQDSALAIAVDSTGNSSVVGQTNSTDFPVTAGAFQASLKGTQNLFVARLDPSGRTLLATYFGGSGSDSPSALQIDSGANFYFAGQTTSFDLPVTAGAFQPLPLVPLWNQSGPGGFVARLNADGHTLAWSTYVLSNDSGTSSSNGVARLAVNASGETYLAGIAGVGFPITSSAPQPCFGGNTVSSNNVSNAFVAHLDPLGALLDATYIGQSVSRIQSLALAADGSPLLVWTAAGNTLSQIHFAAEGTSQPACLTPDILNAATQTGSGGTEPQVAPGEIITLVGSGIGPATGVAYQPGPQGQAPLQLAGVQVLFDGVPAPVLYAQSRQINAIAPVELSSQTATAVSVIYNQATLGTIAATVQGPVPYPTFFRANPGVSEQALAINEDGSVNGPSKPAPRGAIVSLWGTGIGPLASPCATGALNAPGPVNLAPSYTLRIYDQQAPFSPDVLGYSNPAVYAGGAPTLLCGVEQVNFQVPAYAKPGIYQFFPWLQMQRPAGDSLVVMSQNPVTIFIQ